MTDPKRPETVPDNAVWNAGDQEWEQAPKDADGKRHGVVAFWRADGSLVNHCSFEHGTPHGWYKRYHQSGEVSRHGHFERGQIHGVDTFIRSDAATTENFPAGLSQEVWRAEMDMNLGRTMGGRCFTRDGTQCSESGEPTPDRPAGVPDDAVHSSTTGRWLRGVTNESYQRDGVWQFYEADGRLSQEIIYEGGEERESRVYGTVEEANVWVALREGRNAEAVSAASLLLDGEAGSEAVVAADLLIRAQRASGAPDAAVVPRVRATVESVQGSEASWGVFTSSGRRALQAMSRCEMFLGDDARTRSEHSEAVEFFTSALRHGGNVDAAWGRYQSLVAVGRDDEAFQTARIALLADPDAAAFAEVAGSEAFSEWKKSISADGMTIEGAWEVLGARGERLPQIVRAIRNEEPGDGAGYGITAWDGGAVKSHWSAELSRYATDQIAFGLQSGYRGDFTPPLVPILSDAIGAEDGTWVARIQSCFLPVSAVQVEDEEYTVASWAGNSRGASTVFFTHQDEPGEFYARHASLSAFFASRIMEDTAFEELVLPEAMVQQWQRAIELCRESVAAEDVPKHLNVEALIPRTRWVVEFLLGLGIFEPLADVPTNDDWRQERDLALQWPHLQAYWLFHHLVFDHREALADLIERADLSHPTVAELVTMAKRLVVGDVPESFWDQVAVHGARVKALDKGLDVFSEGARIRLEAATADQRAAEEAMRAARAEVEQLEGAERVLGGFDLLASGAGNLLAFEEAGAKQMHPDFDEFMDVFMRVKSGHLSILQRIYYGWGEIVTEAWTPFFEAAVGRGAEMSEEHEAAVPGALFGLGVALGSFAQAMAAVMEQPFYPEQFGPRRRLEMVLVANHYFSDPDARAFLISEAERYGTQFSGWSRDTTVSALNALLLKKDPEAGRIVSEMFTEASFSGANWKSALDLIARCVTAECTEAAPGLKAAMEKGLGRHDDGDRAEVIQAYALLAGKAEAVPVLEGMLATVKDVRKECEEAALIAGLLAVDPTNPAGANRAQATLGAILAGRFDSMRYGAGVSLLKAVHAAELAGFGAIASQFQEKGEGEKYAKDKLKAWLQENLPSFK